MRCSFIEFAIMYLLSLLLLLSSAAASLAQNCNAVTGDHAYCACTMEDGSGTVDISSYANTDNTPKFQGVNDDYTYYYNPCYPMNVDGVADCSDSTAAGCQVATNSPTDGFKIGGFDAAAFSIDPDTNNVIITYTGGDDSRQMTVLLMCNPVKSEPKFTANGEPERLTYHKMKKMPSQLQYDIYCPAFTQFRSSGFNMIVSKNKSVTLESKCSCPYKEGESCTKDNGGGGNNPGKEKKKSKHDPGIVGIILLCLALAAFISYFVIGAIILRVRYQKSGSELIVNKEFWKDFPILVKDGFVFTFSPCYKMIKNRQGGYSTFK